MRASKMDKMYMAIDQYGTIYHGLEHHRNDSDKFWRAVEGDK